MGFRGWEQVNIKADQGTKEKGIAPIIISASRSTDIPAFYAEWFFNRFDRGYCKWINPFNRRPQYVSFEKVKFVVFWSKNPRPILRYLHKLHEKGIGWYFQFTVNDYDSDGFEPNVPSLDERIETFHMLSEKAGKERVIWRFDPLILTDTLRPDNLLKKVEGVGEMIHRSTEKLVISFADISNYAKVKQNLKADGVNWEEFDEENIDEIASSISALAKKWNLKVSTCGERVDLERHGISHNRCIDDELMMRISGPDRELAKFLGYSSDQGSLFSGQVPNNDETSKNHEKHPLKDKGQRKECGCIVSKDIGQYNTCAHLCIYCYANTSQKVVKANREKVSRLADSIL